jgi:glycosyltransferase involved in cell wall biosynthesis
MSNLLPHIDQGHLSIGEPSQELQAKHSSQTRINTGGRSPLMLLLSSVIPQNTTATEVVLYRHFTQWPDVTLAIATTVPQVAYPSDFPEHTWISLSQHSWLERLTRTRVARAVHLLRQALPTINITALRYWLRDHRPDVILTVAHGELCWVAQAIAQEYNIPLVTLFHDWWPELAYIPDYGRKWLEKKFRRLYQSSDCALCVSPAMKQALGEHSNSSILFPIPNHIEVSASVEREKNHPFTVVYAGNLSDVYAPMIRALANAWIEYAPNFQLKLFGATPDWPDAEINAFRRRGIYQGFVSRECLDRALIQADMLLVVMPFQAQYQKRVMTSFPSKLIEYAQLNKPMIIWGPEYCSAVQWSKTYQLGFSITSLDPSDVLYQLQHYFQNILVQNDQVSPFYFCSISEFHSTCIQRQFIQIINKTIHNLESPILE